MAQAFQGEAVAGVNAGVPPRTPVELAIAEIWAAVLGRAGVGVHDDFFELNGNSLTAIEVITRIRKRWGVSIQSMSFFEDPTVAALAAAVTAGAEPDRPAVAPRAADDESVLSFDQLRLWLEHQLRPDAAYNVHGRIRLTGRLDVAALEDSVRAILARHEALRTRFPTVDGRPLQVVDPVDDGRPITVLDATETPGDAAARTDAARVLADEDAAALFDLANGPLFRATLIRYDTDAALLSITAHHIVCDDWSTGLFMQELSALYAAGGDAGRAGLAPLTVQYRDFAAWQRQWMAGDAITAQVEHWRTELDGAPPELTLPTVAWRPPDGERRGHRLRVRLSPEESGAVRDLCRAQRVTTFMALMASFATVLGRWSGQDDVVVGVPITGRTDPGTRPLIGFFVNTLPMRLDLSGDPSFANLLDRVRRAALRSYGNADAPLETLVQQLEVTRIPGRPPLFQAALNVVDDIGVAPLAGLETVVLDAPAPPSKFDVTLNARESGGIIHSDLEYDAQRFDPAMIEAFYGEVVALLLASAAAPNRPVREHPPVTALPAPPAAGGSAVAADDRVAVLSTGPLPAGVTAQPLGDRVALDDPAALLDRLRTDATTALVLEPPLLRALAAAASDGLPQLRSIIVGHAGDLLAPDVVAARTLGPLATITALHTGGGSPVSAYAIPAGWSPDTAPLRVPLGTALAEPVTVRRTDGTAAGAGEVGEIHVGDRATGDRGRQWTDTTLEFVPPAGRDLAPLVATLREAPGVTDAVVVEHSADEDTEEGRTVLVAHVAGPDPDAGSGTVHQHLITRLADHLLPQHLFVHERLPLRPDGGYDLAVLPVPDVDSPELDTYVAARTSMERRLVAILHELLDVDRIGVYDSFFELGGFSLLATRLVARVRDEFGVDIALRELFLSATVDQLARLVLTAQAQLSDIDEIEAFLDELSG